MPREFYNLDIETIVKKVIDKQITEDISGQMVELKQRIGRCESSVIDIKRDVSEIRTELTNITTNVSKMNDKINNLEDGFIKLEHNIASFLKIHQDNISNQIKNSNGELVSLVKEMMGLRTNNNDGNQTNMNH